MKKNISRNPLWPDWYNGKKIDEVQFGRAFLEQWPLKCVNGTLYTLDGPVEDESEIKQRILENIEEYVTSGLSKKVTNILETIKLLAFSDPFPIEQDCIHFQNGVYHLPDGSFQESRLFCQNRLPVKYDPKAASPDRWLTFLHELLDDATSPPYRNIWLLPDPQHQGTEDDAHCRQGRRGQVSHWAGAEAAHGRCRQQRQRPESGEQPLCPCRSGTPPAHDRR